MVKSYYQSEVFTTAHGFTGGIEGPACDAAGNLYAVNYDHEGTIGMVTPDGECSVYVELPSGSIANGIRFNQAGEMLLADYTNHNILKIDPKTREITVHAHEPSMNQPNDIAIAASGIVFASDPNWAEETGQIWRITPDGKVDLLEANMGTTNGIEVSPDEKTLYVNESVQRNIWAYDLSETGEISNKRLLIQFEDFGLDGMRCDAEGYLYSTRFGKGTIVKLSPQGEIVQEIKLHGTNCTNLTFGGVDGCTVYVTLADQGNVEKFRVESPGRCRVLCGVIEVV
ncbi:SMP-30/gluconolactonase/LRE family protein [Paenibacillus sp. N1-5-1-14]|uniref:SMP-30/gluconolactonase/LRE family protein n=1 Tax=Paenibacillus radicibacter TaxID=2972488 RepID=UPI002159B547|nr:SMP-30/gluconolactonase/LRE family protein [Paenibacillus radicibacter]MCR8642462.1 SMP-30/gluconolactonase/LRE family protein [Paenibacillus radicibacter]